MSKIEKSDLLTSTIEDVCKELELDKELLISIYKDCMISDSDTKDAERQRSLQIKRYIEEYINNQQEEG